LNRNAFPIRLGNNHLIPQGTFIQKDKPATVISAYYEMKSKYTLEDYRRWIEIFLKNNKMYLIFFTEINLSGFISECRRGYEDRTTIIILPREEWVANTYEQKVWDALHTIDPEKEIHNPELYKVWFEKIEFVRRGIQLNPYGHDDFLWVDAGICRKESLKRIIPNFPDASRIPVDKIMVSNVMPFTKSDNKILNVNGIDFIGGVTGKDRIAAGIICGRKEIWDKYITVFNKTIEKYIKAEKFWGKEQDIMRTMVLENKELFSLVEVRPIIEYKWEYQLIYLGSKRVVHERMIDEKENKDAKSNEELERIGGGECKVGV
jgi:hypothetical protein